MPNKGLTDPDYPASETALALTAWWRRQRRWKTKTEAADAIGIPRSTFKDYFYGAKPTALNRAKLYAATDLEIFAGDGPPARGAQTQAPVGESDPDHAAREADARLAEVSQTLRTLSDQFADLHKVLDQLKAKDGPARVIAFPAGAAADQRAEATVQLLYRLIAALETFRSSARDREALRRALHGPDVGYLYSLADALLDEEKFERWGEISSYRPLGARR